MASSASASAHAFASARAQAEKQAAPRGCAASNKPLTSPTSLRATHAPSVRAACEARCVDGSAWFRTRRRILSASASVRSSSARRSTAWPSARWRSGDGGKRFASSPRAHRALCAAATAGGESRCATSTQERSSGAAPETRDPKAASVAQSPTSAAAAAAAARRSPTAQGSTCAASGPCTASHSAATTFAKAGPSGVRIAETTSSACAAAVAAPQSSSASPNRTMQKHRAATNAQRSAPCGYVPAAAGARASACAHWSSGSAFQAGVAAASSCQRGSSALSRPRISAAASGACCASAWTAA
mmetsp:Transcript_21721/g.74657  ORF Transcript_21721/g.74657 Transcript_21721/m.74657 type:complete len:301 (+) Transcript_21721:1161-2063(+)